MRRPVALLAFAIHAALSSGAAAADPPTRRFPAEFSGGVVRVDPERFEALRGLDRVRLVGVPVEGEGRTLLLRRVPACAAGARLRAGGADEPLAELARHVFVYRGRLEEAPASRAFLALTPSRVLGWVSVEGKRLPIGPPPGASAAMLPQAAPLRCGAADIDQPLAPDPVFLSAQAQAAGYAQTAGQTTLLARIAVETDHQFFQLFGDATLAGTYALALLGAVSDLYEEQIGVRLEVAYLGLHPEAQDPWQSQDMGGDALALLVEFRQAWKNGKAPVPADAHLFLCGADLGGGIAYLNALCSPAFSFAVAGDLTGQAPLPPSGQAAWDPLVVAHELGHVFVSPHTHDYCPPLDECAPPPYFGACQNAQTCVPDGTIMSYCHLCPGGLANVGLAFHPTVAAALRLAAEGSCLEEVAPPHELCSSASAGLFAALDPEQQAQETLTLAVGDCGTSSDPIAVGVALDPDVPWASVSPTAGTVGPGALDVDVDVDVSSLAPGAYSTTLRIVEDLDPTDVLEVPLAVTVLGAPFVSKDRLVGSLDAGDAADEARVELVADARLRLTTDTADALAPLRVELRDVHDLLLAQWIIPPGGQKKLTKKLHVDGPVRVVFAGEGAGSYTAEAKVKWPKKAKPKKTKKKPAAGTDFVEVVFRAPAGALLDAWASPKPKDSGSAALLLIDPEGDAVDLTGHLDASGLQLSGLPIDLSGAWRLRVTGVIAQVKIGVEPHPPVGGADVAID